MNRCPLVVAALELGVDAEKLAARAYVGEHIIVDDSSGVRCLPSEIVRRLLDEAAQRAEAARRQQQELSAYVAAQLRPLHRGLALRAERQRELLRQNPNLDAHAVMCADSGDPDGALNAAGDRFDELMNAGRRGEAGMFHRFAPRKE